MAIGGLKEKSMAAYKTGVKTVYIPIDNLPNLEEVDSIVKENVKFVAVSTVDEIMSGALERMPNIKCTDKDIYSVSNIKSEQKGTAIHQ